MKGASAQAGDAWKPGVEQGRGEQTPLEPSEGEEAGLCEQLHGQEPGVLRGAAEGGGMTGAPGHQPAYL